MASGTIEAYIRRFREQPPAPPEKRYVPNDVDFWWQKNNFSDEKKQGVMGRSSESTKRGERYSRHVEERGYFDEDHDGEEDISENNHYDDADTLNRSQNTQLTDENYGDEDDNDDDDGDGELDDFEKRSESLMKKCDNLLSNIDPSETIQNMEPTSRPPPPPPIPPLLPNGNKMMESEEFAPWVSVDVPNSLTNPSDGNPYDTLLSPIKSTSPPTVDDRISPDSIDPLNNHDQHHQQEQHSHDYDEISEESNKNNDEHDDHLPDTESDSDSDISDLEETSVETTDELIKRAERLLNGYSIGEQLQQQSQHSQQQSTLSISSQETANLENSLNSLDHLPLPTPSADIPIPEIPPTRLLTPITEISSTQQQSQQSISPTPLQFKTNVTEIGVQTDFQSIDPPLNSSIMSSTTTLFISPVSTPRHSPLEMPSFSDDKNSTHQQQPQQTQEGGALNKASFPSSLHPPFVVETSQHQQSNSFPTNTPAPLPPLSMEGFSNMSYEEIEPYLSDEIISTLWNRLVIVREQMKYVNKKRRK